MLLSVGCTRKDHIGTMRPRITVVTLVHDECPFWHVLCCFISTHEVHKVRRGIACTTRHEAKLQRTNSCSGCVQDVEPIPVIREEIGHILRQGGHSSLHSSSILTSQATHAQHDHWSFSRGEGLTEGVLTLGERSQSGSRVP